MGALVSQAAGFAAKLAGKLGLGAAAGSKAISTTAKQAAKVAKTEAKQATKTAKARAAADVKIAKMNAKAEAQKAKLQMKSAALSKTPTGSKAMSVGGKIINGLNAAGNLAITGFLGWSLIDGLLHPEDPLPQQGDPNTQGGLIDEGGVLGGAEDFAEEILDPLSDLPLVGDAVDAAAENRASLPLLILILILIAAAVFAVVKIIQKKGKKPARKRTRKPAKKGVAA